MTNFNMELTIKDYRTCVTIAKVLSKIEPQAGAKYLDKYEVRRVVQRAAVLGLNKPW